MYALSDAVTRIMYSVTFNRYETVLRLGINMNYSWKILAVIIAALFIVPLAVTDGADGADSKSFTITDGTGREFTFDGPSEKIVALGKGTNLTIAELGCLDKVVAVDTWSMPAKANDERLSGLNAVDVGSDHEHGVPKEAYFRRAVHDPSIHLQWHLHGQRLVAPLLLCHLALNIPEGNAKLELKIAMEA